MEVGVKAEDEDRAVEEDRVEVEVTPRVRVRARAEWEATAPARGPVASAFVRTVVRRWLIKRVLRVIR